jgi:hypothetical protein
VTGPEHYVEGEKWLKLAQLPPSDGGPMGLDQQAVMVETASAHFAAAQVAATATGIYWRDSPNQPAEWAEAIL